MSMSCYDVFRVRGNVIYYGKFGEERVVFVHEIKLLPDTPAFSYKSVVNNHL